MSSAVPLCYLPVPRGRPRTISSLVCLVLTPMIRSITKINNKGLKKLSCLRPTPSRNSSDILIQFSPQHCTLSPTFLSFSFFHYRMRPTHHTAAVVIPSSNNAGRKRTFLLDTDRPRNDLLEECVTISEREQQKKYTPPFVPRGVFLDRSPHKNKYSSTLIYTSSFGTGDANAILST